MKLKKILGSVTEKVGNIRISGISLNSKNKKEMFFFQLRENMEKNLLKI